MPIKKRTERARRLPDGVIDELMFGPGTCLLAGHGYFRGHFGGYFHNLKPPQQRVVIDAARADWELHSAKVMAAWAEHRATSCHAACDCGAAAEPWALTAFGMPAR